MRYPTSYLSVYGVNMTKKVLLFLWLFIFSFNVYAHCCPGSCCTPEETPEYKIQRLNIDFNNYIPVREKQIRIQQHPDLYSYQYKNEVNKAVDDYEQNLKSRLLDIRVMFVRDYSNKVFELAQQCADFIDFQNMLNVHDPRLAHEKEYRAWQNNIVIAMNKAIKNHE